MLEPGRNAMRAGTTRADRRNENRSEVFLATIVVQGRSDLIPAELVNLSHAGFLIRTKARFRKGDKLKIALPVLGYVQVKVAWGLSGCAGCEFLTTLDDDQFSRLLKGINQAKPGWLETLPK